MSRAVLVAAVMLLPGLARAATLANPYLSLELDPASGAVVHMAADAGGQGHFGTDLLTGDGLRLGPAGLACKQATSTDIACDGPSGASVALRLGPADRGVHVRVTAPSVSLTAHHWFMSGIFARGVVQYVAGQDQHFAATSPLDLFYTMDRTRGSLALVPDGRLFATLVSGRADQTGLTLSAEPPAGAADSWQPAHPVPAATQAAPIGFTLYGNDRPYPAHLPARTIAGPDGVADRDAALIAAYGSAAGVLGTYLDPGAAYPTLAQPTRTYGKAFTFFDPDAWSTVTTLAFSGDKLLQREARGILERAAAAMLPDGQIPHHFEPVGSGPAGPTYVSIATSKQTGPNIFWTLAAIEYATAAGDEAWLQGRYPTLKRATEWLLAAYDPARHLIHADGPLFIDVFRRDGFTLDTNMMAVHLLDRMAGTARFANDADGAQRYGTLAADIRTGLAALANGDHYVTQLNADGTRRDLVDYDGNYGAVAFAHPANAPAILARLDSGPHTHPGGYGTWVSEKRYDKAECYGGNDGDSDTAMARIWWLDMLARVATGDHATFDALLDRHRALILDRVWMTERIGAEGTPIRAPGYHEYPEILDMVTRELRYGIRLAPDAVTISPFGVAAYDYAMGDLHVVYGPDSVLLHIPGTSARAIRIEGLRAGRSYRLSMGETVRVAEDGALAFTGQAGTTITATAVP